MHYITSCYGPSACPASCRWPCLDWAPASADRRERLAPLLPPGPRVDCQCCWDEKQLASVPLNLLDELVAPVHAPEVLRPASADAADATVGRPADLFALA